MFNEFYGSFWHVDSEDSTPVITVVCDQVMISNSFEVENVCNPIWIEPDAELAKQLLVG